MPSRKLKAMFQVSETSFSPPTSGRLLELATLLIRNSALAYWIQVLSCLFHFTCRILHEVCNQFYISIASIVQQNSPQVCIQRVTYEQFAASKPQHMTLYRLCVHIILFSNQILITVLALMWVGQRSRYRDWVRARRSGDLIPVGGEIFRTCPDRPWNTPSLLYNGYRVFRGGKKWPERDADPSPPSSAVGHERVELYLYSPYLSYGLYRVSGELYLYSPYGPYGLYRASVEL